MSPLCWAAFIVGVCVGALMGVVLMAGLALAAHVDRAADRAITRIAERENRDW